MITRKPSLCEIEDGFEPGILLQPCPCPGASGAGAFGVSVDRFAANHAFQFGLPAMSLRRRGLFLGGLASAVMKAFQRRASNWNTRRSASVSKAAFNPVSSINSVSVLLPDRRCLLQHALGGGRHAHGDPFGSGFGKVGHRASPRPQFSNRHCQGKVRCAAAQDEAEFVARDPRLRGMTAAVRGGANRRSLLPHRPLPLLALDPERDHVALVQEVRRLHAGASRGSRFPLRLAREQLAQA
jgi:hypothetical protein